MSTIKVELVSIERYRRDGELEERWLASVRITVDKLFGEGVDSHTRQIDAFEANELRDSINAICDVLEALPDR